MRTEGVPNEGDQRGRCIHCQKCRQELSPGVKARTIGRRLYHEECYRKLVRNQARRDWHAILTDLGLKRVKGGTYL